MCAVLLKHGATHAAIRDGATPLSVAANFGHGNVCVLLLDWGANLESALASCHGGKQAVLAQAVTARGHRRDLCAWFVVVASILRSQERRVQAARDMCRPTNRVTPTLLQHFPAAVLQLHVAAFVGRQKACVCGAQQALDVCLCEVRGVRRDVEDCSESESNSPLRAAVSRSCRQRPARVIPACGNAFANHMRS